MSYLKELSHNLSLKTIFSKKKKKKKQENKQTKKTKTGGYLGDSQVEVSRKKQVIGLGLFCRLDWHLLHP
jgi:hypothetical protein